MTEKYSQAPKQCCPSPHMPQSPSSDPCPANLMVSVVLTSRVQLWSNSCLEEHLLRSHSERCVFGTCELLKLDSCCDFRWSFRSAKVPGKANLVVVGGCRDTFSCWWAGSWTQKNAFGSILYGKRWEREWKRAFVDVLYHQNVPSFLKSFLFMEGRWCPKLQFRS